MKKVYRNAIWIMFLFVNFVGLLLFWCLYAWNILTVSSFSFHSPWENYVQLVRLYLGFVKGCLQKAFYELKASFVEKLYVRSNSSVPFMYLSYSICASCLIISLFPSCYQESVKRGCTRRVSLVIIIQMRLYFLLFLWPSFSIASSNLLKSIKYVF